MNKVWNSSECLPLLTYNGVFINYYRNNVQTKGTSVINNYTIKIVHTGLVVKFKLISVCRFIAASFETALFLQNSRWFTIRFTIFGYPISPLRYLIIFFLNFLGVCTQFLFFCVTAFFIGLVNCYSLSTYK